jgi:hypothetical protein
MRYCHSNARLTVPKNRPGKFSPENDKTFLSQIFFILSVIFVWHPISVQDATNTSKNGKHILNAKIIQKSVGPKYVLIFSIVIGQYSK